MRVVQIFDVPAAAPRGAIPNLLDALDLANGQSTRMALAPTAANTNDACAPGCC
jgi:hypothetical protein